MREVLERLKVLQEEEALLTKQLVPFLEKFGAYAYKHLDCFPNIRVSDNVVEFDCADGGWGNWDTYCAAVSWDYFDDPDEYIRKDKIHKIEEKERLDNDYKERQRQAELKMFEELRKKYES